MEVKKVWFVTGASKGLGLYLVKKLLANGYHVAATTRNLQSLIDEVGEVSETFLPLEVNLNDDNDVKTVIEKSIVHFSKIDVIVNNAGFGQFGTLEELSDTEARENFDINIFGMLNVIRHSMPYFREKKSGHYINISSIGGFYGAFAGWGIYCATKFAVAGLTEALSAEAKAFGVNTTVVYPGYFRTDFLSNDSLRTPKNPINEYAEARQSQAEHQNEIGGNQPGDPEKAALAFITLAESENPPLHLFLGTDSNNMAKMKIEILQNELIENELLGKSTDFA